MKSDPTRNWVKFHVSKMFFFSVGYVKILRRWLNQFVEAKELCIGQK